MSSDGRVKALDFEEKYVHNIYDSLATHRALADRINATVLPRVNLQTKTNNNHRNGRSKNGKCWGKIVEFLKEFSNTSIVGDIGEFPLEEIINCITFVTIFNQSIHNIGIRVVWKTHGWTLLLIGYLYSYF